MENVIAIRKIPRAVFTAFALNVVLVGIFSIFVYFFDMPEKLVSAVIIILSSLCVFFCGTAMARNIEKRGFLNGLVFGMVYLLLIFAVSLAAFGEISVTLHNGVRSICIMLSAIFGGVIGINAKE